MSTYNGQVSYDFDMFETDLKFLHNQLVEKHFDLVIGIARGGVIPATCLSHAINRPMTTIDYSLRDGCNIQPRCLTSYFRELSVKYKKVLLVDDMIDSGRSIIDIVHIAKNFVDVSVAVLLYNSQVKLPVDCYYGHMYNRDIDKRYYDFWWETI